MQEKTKPKKQLGQNFLINNGVCEKIADAACDGVEGMGVLEIGPGLGALTCRLAKRAKKVVAVELDTDIIPKLRENLKDFDNVHIIEGDILKTDVAALIEEHFAGMPVAIAGNLPYYITSPILMMLLESRLPVRHIVAMVQKEAAQRLCAPEASRDCGAVTLAVRYYSDPAILFDVSPGSFYPPPKVTSSVIRLNVRETPAAQPADEKRMFAVIRAAFSQRRKTAANAIAAGLPADKGAVSDALAAIGAAPSVRPERMTLAQFAALSDRL